VWSRRSPRRWASPFPRRFCSRRTGLSTEGSGTPHHLGTVYPSSAAHGRGAATGVHPPAGGFSPAALPFWLDRPAPLWQRSLLHGPRKIGNAHELLGLVKQLAQFWHRHAEMITPHPVDVSRDALDHVGARIAAVDAEEDRLHGGVELSFQLRSGRDTPLVLDS
jgi:hypothetical protein